MSENNSLETTPQTLLLRADHEAGSKAEAEAMALLRRLTDSQLTVALAQIKTLDGNPPEY